MWFIILYSLVFIFVGLIITKGNANHLIAGLNTASDKELKKLGIPDLATKFKKFHYFLGISTLVIGMVLWKYVNEDIALITVTVYSLVAYLIFIIKNNDYSQANTKAGIYVMVGTIVFVISLFVYGLKEDKMILSDHKIEIEGMYGDDILYSDIYSVSFVDTMPEITLKINGFGMEKVKKGYFKKANGEKILLILNSPKTPICITLNNRKEIYYSSKSEIENVMFYKNLDKKLESLYRKY